MPFSCPKNMGHQNPSHMLRLPRTLGISQKFQVQNHMPLKPAGLAKAKSPQHQAQIDLPYDPRKMPIQPNCIHSTTTQASWALGF